MTRTEALTPDLTPEDLARRLAAHPEFRWGPGMRDAQ